MPRRRRGPRDDNWEFPKGKLSLGDAVKEAQQAIKADYYDDVRGIAKDVADELEKGKFRNAEELMEYLEQSVDGSQRVIYTQQAKLGLLASDNEDAAFDEGFEIDASEGIPYEKLMYFAMVKDVIEDLASEFEIDVADPFEDDEDEDEEEADEEDED